jgi:penicillin-binding protein 1A
MMIFHAIGLLVKGIVLTVLFIGLILVSFLAGFFTEVIREVPLIENLNVPNPAITSRIYDTEGKVLLGNLFSEENRILVSYGQIPDDLKYAVIAVEDKGFYQHPGVSVRGMLRAVFTNLREARLAQGGSTLTQQFVRSIYLSQEKTWRRKLLEIIISLKLEQRFSKDEILTFYLNEVFFGRNAYGVEAASQTYFGKHVSDLTLSEAAMLAGLPQRPSAYAPRPDNMEAALERRKVVLDAMLEGGYIGREEYDRALKEELVIQPPRDLTYKGLSHPYFTTYVINEVKEILGNRGLLSEGLNVYTTVNLEMQSAAERILPKKIAEYAKYNISQGALMTIDPKTGAILAMVGGVDFNTSELNRAWQANRQAGSAFKPFVYLKAIEDGFSPSSLIVDEHVRYPAGGQTYIPHNYDNSYEGVMTAIRALARSRNICAVKTIDIVGPDKVVELCKRLGFESMLYPYLSLGLGSSEVTVEEMCGAFATFANDGQYNKPFSVWRITDSTGKVIYERQLRPEQVVKQNDIRLLNAMTQAVVSWGTGTRAKLPGRVVAGKTGTTSDYSDAWFIGYMPDVCTAVWVGNDRVVDFMKRVTGGVYPAVIWHDYMAEIIDKFPIEEFPKPIYPSRVKPLDKTRTNAELQAMLQLQQEEAGEESAPDEAEGGGSNPPSGGGGEKPPGAYF